MVRLVAADVGDGVRRNGVRERREELHSPVDAAGVHRVVAAVEGLQVSSATSGGRRLAAYVAVVVLALERHWADRGHAERVPPSGLRRLRVHEWPRDKAKVVAPPSVVVMDVQLHDRVRHWIVERPREMRCDGRVAAAEQLDRGPLGKVQHHRLREGLAAAMAQQHPFPLHAQAHDRCVVQHLGPVGDGQVQQPLNEGQVPHVLPVRAHDLVHAVVPVRRVWVVGHRREIQLVDHRRRDGRADCPVELPGVHVHWLWSEAVAPGLNHEVLPGPLTPQRVDPTTRPPCALEDAHRLAGHRSPPGGVSASGASPNHAQVEGRARAGRANPWR
mmetsp:Transcript_104948/g.297072  ORF Transcript_104948/g.297072 Transcript_104948/m.297072 type:complete len:330 (-) Transcript_104948:103-1092(-)